VRQSEALWTTTGRLEQKHSLGSRPSGRADNSEKDTQDGVSCWLYEVVLQFAKAPPETVIQKGVQERVETAVGITQTSDEVGNPNNLRSLWDVCGEGDHCAKVIGCPAEQTHSQDDNHHQCHFFFCFIQGFCIAMKMHTSQSAQHDGIEDADGGHWDSKA